MVLRRVLPSGEFNGAPQRKFARARGGFANAGVAGGRSLLRRSAGGRGRPCRRGEFSTDEALGASGFALALERISRGLSVPVGNRKCPSCCAVVVVPIGNRMPRALAAWDLGFIVDATPDWCAVGAIARCPRH